MVWFVVRLFEGTTDGKIGNGLKLEKIREIFQVLMLRLQKILRKFIMVSPLIKFI